ncbi:MAG: molybdopterin molybdotransferase MoeA [Thermodesulfovibrionia bacterium]|nr:molybdopterin molybdotransferase MoeA [Thermodesulfovibrionia bacterium]
MISVDEALKTVLDSVKGPLGSESVGIIESLGRVLAEDIHSGSDLPAFDYSAMDGFAVKHSDIKDASLASGIRLKIAGEFRAGGDTSSKVSKGEAVKIMTGAPIPEGADAVVMVENTKEAGGFVEVFEQVEKGDNIRLAGEDIKKGDLVLEKGSLIGPAHIGMLASMGIAIVNVSKRPKVAILTTGDEVLSIEEKLLPGKIRNSNAYSLFTQVIASYAMPVNKGVAKDNKMSLSEGLKSCLECDIIVTSGGVSMGEYDYVKEVMNELGMDEKFWKVAMRPGKPNLFGTIAGKPFFGLPGNPVSTMIGFEVFVRPAIMKMLGRKGGERREVEALLEEDVKTKKGLTFFVRAQTRWEDGGYVTKTTGQQGSGMLSSMVKADSLIIVPEDVDTVKKGSRVKVRMLT